MEKKSLVLILILCLANQSLAGALVPRYSGKPQINIFEQFWEKMNNFVTGGLHLVGSILPLRGLAMIAKDLGFSHADSILDALTPTKRSPNRFFEITRCLIIKTDHRPKLIRGINKSLYKNQTALNLRQFVAISILKFVT